MDSLLSGIKVIDLSQVFAGPGAAMHLADFGADVVKLEPPWGEIVRGWNTDGDPMSRASAYLTVNRGKSNIAIDLYRPAGRELFYELVEGADVVVTNQRSEAAARMALDYESLRKRNDRIIYAHVTGYGASGEESNRPAFDLLVQARSGVMSMRTNSAGRPVSAPFPMADLSASVILAMAVCAALYAREVCGHGCQVETSLLDAALAMQRTETVRTTTPMTPRGSYAFYDACRCADGRYLIFATQQNRRWRELCTALDLDHLVDAPHFASFADRTKNGDELFKFLDAAFATRPAAEWLDRLRAADVPAEIVFTRDEILDDQQARVNGAIMTYQDGYFGQVDMVGPAFRVNGRADQAQRMPAGIGTNTVEVLRDYGISEQRIADLTAEGVISVDDRATVRPAADAS